MLFFLLLMGLLESAGSSAKRTKCGEDSPFSAQESWPYSRRIRRTCSKRPLSRSFIEAIARLPVVHEYVHSLARAAVQRASLHRKDLPDLAQTSLCSIAKTGLLHCKVTIHKNAAINSAGYCACSVVHDLAAYQPLRRAPVPPGLQQRHLKGLSQNDQPFLRYAPGHLV